MATLTSPYRKRNKDKTFLCPDLLSRKLKSHSQALRSFSLLAADTLASLDRSSKSLTNVIDSFPKDHPDFDATTETLDSLCTKAKEFVKELRGICAASTKEVADPLSGFQAQYDQQNTLLVKECRVIQQDLTEARKQTEKDRDTYFRAEVKLLSAKRALTDAKPGSGRRLSSDAKINELLDATNQRDLAVEKYKKSIEHANDLITKHADVYQSLTESTLQLERMRADFVHDWLRRYAKSMEQVAKVWLDRAAAVTAAAEHIDSKAEEKTLFDENKRMHTSRLFDYVKFDKYNPEYAHQFVSYETDSSMILGAEEAQSGVKLELSEGYFGGPEAKAVKATMEQFFQKLVADGENVAVTTEEKAKIGEEMKKPVGKGVFLSLLRQFVGKPTVCSSRENFAAFCDLVHQFLTILAAEKEHNNAGAVCIVLDVGRFVYLKLQDTKRPTYMHTALAGHEIWKNFGVWKRLLELMVGRKMREIREGAERQRARKLAEKGFFSKWAKVMTTKVVSLFDTDPTISPALDEDDEKVLSLSVAAALTVFVQHLVHCKANGDPRARGLVAECAERYKVTSTALLDLQLGLKMDLPFEPAKLGGKKKDVVVEKSKRRLGKLGDFSLGLAVGGAVPFVSDLDTLRSLLLLSRKTSGVLRTPVLRHVLFRLGPKLSSPARVAIWSQILELHRNTVDYKQIVQKLAATKGLPQEVEELIALDVHRSFQSLKVIKHESLISILRVYATHRKDVEYCQGMNFLAGFFLLLTGEEAAAFNLLQAVIAKFSMTHLFTPNVPLLKQYFHTLDRILYAKYPELSLCFRNEGISSSYFSSTWFITLFTNSLQYAKDEKPPELLIAIWDAFLVDGWKAVFRAAIFILGELEGRLLDSRLDNVMMTLGELPKGSFMLDPGTVARFRAGYSCVRVTNGLLSALGKEYEQLYREVMEQAGN